MHPRARPTGASRHVQRDSGLSRVVRSWHRGGWISVRRAWGPAVTRIPRPEGLDVVQDARPGCVHPVDPPKRAPGPLSRRARDETGTALRWRSGVPMIMPSIGLLNDRTV